ncbi:MAG: glycosyltransferase [Desulfomicrobium sp.]|nr:glycosyltransferase [Desulfomicrobium sp.]
MKINNINKHLNDKKWHHKLYNNYFCHAIVNNDKQKCFLSIVIISHSYNNILLDNIKNIVSQRSENIDFQLVFLNNGDNDIYYDLIKKYVDIYIKLNTNTGVCVGRNIASIFTNSKFIVFLEDDCIPNEDIVFKYEKILKRYRPLCVRGAYLPRTDSTLTCPTYFLGKKMFPVYNFAEGNSAYRSNVFFSVGGWDDNIFYGCEGLELSYRLFKFFPVHKEQIYHPELIIYHDAKPDQNKNKKNSDSWNYVQKKHKDIREYMLSYELHKPGVKNIIKRFLSRVNLLDFLRGLRSR